MRSIVVITTCLLLFSFSNLAKAQTCDSLFSSTRHATDLRSDLHERISRRILDLENHQLDLLGQLRLIQRLRKTEKPTVEEMQLSLRSTALQRLVARAKSDPTLLFLEKQNGVDPFWNDVILIEQVFERRRLIFAQTEDQYGSWLPRSTFEKIARLAQDKNPRFLRLQQAAKENQSTVIDLTLLRAELGLPKEFTAKMLMTSFESARLGEPYEVALIRLFDTEGLDVPKSTLSQLSLLTRVITLHEAATTTDGYFEYIGSLGR